MCSEQGLCACYTRGWEQGRTLGAALGNGYRAADRARAEKAESRVRELEGLLTWEERARWYGPDGTPATRLSVDFLAHLRRRAGLDKPAEKPKTGERPAPDAIYWCNACRLFWHPDGTPPTPPGGICGRCGKPPTLYRPATMQGLMPKTSRPEPKRDCRTCRHHPLPTGAWPCTEACWLDSHHPNWEPRPEPRRVWVCEKCGFVTRCVTSDGRQLPSVPETHNCGGRLTPYVEEKP